MSGKSGFEDIPLGMEMGPLELTIDEKVVGDRIEIGLWQGRDLIEKMGLAPPGLTIANHAKMKFMALPEMKASIWAKSEHEFLKPMKIGGRVTIRGKITEKYVKRGRNYVVAEYETVDENGEVLLRSRETGVYVE